MTNQTESQISILVDYYSNRCNLYDAISKYDDESKHFICKSLIKKVCKIWKSTNKTFHCKINKKYNELLLDNLNRHI